MVILVRDLTEREYEIAVEVLSQRKPAYAGERMVVNYLTEGSFSTSPADDGTVLCKASASTYSYEFQARITKDGLLRWFPNGEIQE